VISSGKFTEEAANFVKGKPLELINGTQLQKIITEIQKGQTRTDQETNENLCPMCGAKMVLRMAKKGQNVGDKFWGCSNFPKCRTTKPYNA